MLPVHPEDAPEQRPEFEPGGAARTADPSPILASFAVAGVGGADRFAFRVWIACWLILWLVGLLNWLAT